MRKPIIAGNWKMHNTMAEAKTLVKDLAALVADAQAEVVVCAPFTALAAAKEAAQGTNVKVGAQNIHWEAKGAFTGEISAAMLKEIGVEYVVVGHSERRQYFAETDETVNKRTKAALAAGIIPIVCCGETLEEREANITEKIVGDQVKADLADLTAAEVASLVIAYEPVWAIGTGKTATAEQAQEIHAYIRSTIVEKYGKEVADNTSILYGGSCKASNAKELFANPDVDGGLIGGASLKADDFKGIIDAFNA